MAQQMDDNDDTGRTSVIVRIQNNTDREWIETAWKDEFDEGYPYDIDRRLPEFEDGFGLYPGSEDQILVKANSGAFGISKGCAGNHTFSDGNGKTITFKWKMPSIGDGKIEWKSNDGSLKNAIYYLDREDGWQVIYFLIKTDGKAINELTVADSTLSTFQDVMGFIPIVGDLANTGIYAARGMAKEAILSALGGATGAAGKGLSIAAKSAKYASKASKINKFKKGVETAGDVGQLGVKAGYGDDITKDIVGKAVTKGVGNASKKNLKSQQAKPQTKYQFDMNSSGAPIKESPHRMNNMKLKGAQVFDEYRDEISGFGVDVAFGDNVGDAATSAGVKGINKQVNKGMKHLSKKNMDASTTYEFNMNNDGAPIEEKTSSSSELLNKIVSHDNMSKATEYTIKKLSDLLISGSKTMDKTENFVFKTQFGYMTLNSSGYMAVTQNKDEATRWNEIMYQDIYKQKYYQVASGPWKNYYLSSHWDNGVCVYSGWGDCLYFGYERFRLRCKGAKCNSYSVKFRKETDTFYCYYRSSEYQECIVIKE